jgi:CheY-like chemotaxis protein
VSARILVVEDTPLNIELATDLLEAAGFTVIPAQTAEEGLRLAQAEPPDLVLMDIRLPGMGGHAAMHALKAHERTRGVRVVALTAQAMKDEEAAARDAGFDGYIVKPIDTRTFAPLVAGFLPVQGGA